jgi:O-acetyl-ADP-ribose deacetylase (regulator of RNase III)
VIQYVTGDATAPIGWGPKLIAHVTNSAGGWGKGFVRALSRKWPEPERRYRERPEDHKLGLTQFVSIRDDLVVANMCAQNGYASPARPVAIDYSALETCLTYVADFASTCGMTVHMPRIGCGLGGGHWFIVEGIITRALIHEGIRVTVYDF